MADENPKVPEIEQALDDATGKVGKSTESEPVYRVLPGTKILVSKHHGSLWKDRLGTARQARAKFEAAWKEAIRYYNHDQLEYRQEDMDNTSGNISMARRANEQWTETENVVFANTSTMMPILYSKNPIAEFTSSKHEGDTFAAALEDLVNALATTKHAPGFNLKPKARRGILLALLTNSSWMKINYTFKDAATETHVEQINKLAEELEKAKTTKAIEEIEGKLQALEISVDVSRPEGPGVAVLSPFRLFIDPDSREFDVSDANWIIEEDYLLTQFLNARYGKKKKDGTVESLYKPSHVLRAGSNNDGVEAEIEQFSLLQDSSAGVSYGYSTEESFNRAKHTKVYYVWDRTTKRVYLYADNDWTWPVWVWDDPLHLLNFFPYYPLSFHDNPDGRSAKGEVTYYLDQQDAINEINDDERRARLWVRRNFFYNSNAIDRDQAEAFLKGPDDSALGVDLPEGMKGEDVVWTMPMPSMRFPELFDKKGKYDAINRLSSVSEVMSGVQFKTNTTNKAIEKYNSAAQVRSGEKQDLIEDWIGDILWGIGQLCLQFMDMDTVETVLGKKAEGWTNMSPEDIRSSVSMVVTAGSTQKPTSTAKKKEAVEVGQILGQFAGEAPQVVEIMLRLFEQAFDEIVMKDEDWAALRESMVAAQNKAGAGPGGQPEGQPGASGGGDIEQMIQQLPPEAQAALQQAVQQGVPREVALERIMQRLQQ